MIKAPFGPAPTQTNTRIKRFFQANDLTAENRNHTDVGEQHHELSAPNATLELAFIVFLCRQNVEKGLERAIRVILQIALENRRAHGEQA